jgi:protein associated with RNAse G/E
VVESSQIAEPGSILVRALKHDGLEHRRWSAKLRQQEASLIVLDAMFDREIEHDLLGTISQGTLSVEYYWLDRWYNVFRFLGPEGALRNFYCNINQPPDFDGRVLSYVDLDIDVLVQPDFSFRILDLDEFEQNAVRYRYPFELQNCARKALDELVERIENRKFPFSE